MALSWTQTENLPISVTLFGLTEYNGYIYLIGGVGGDGSILNSVYRTNDFVTWSQITQTTPFTARYGHYCFTYDNKIYILNGYTGVSVDRTIYYSTDGANWTSVGSHGGTVNPQNFMQPYSGDGYVWDLTAYNWLYSSDVLNQSTGPSSPGFYDPKGSGQLEFNSLLYISYPTGRVVAFNGSTNSTKTSNAAYADRYGISTLTYKGTDLYILGGGTYSGGDPISCAPYFNDVWVSTDGGANWSQDTAAAPWDARNGHRTINFNGEIYILGGHDSITYTGGNHPIASANTFSDVWTTAEIPRNGAFMFKYGGSQHYFSDITAPVYPNRLGMQFYSNQSNKRYYSVTNRYHGTSSEVLNVQDIQQSDRNSIYDFWDSTLSRGNNTFTLVDHRNRILFDTFWQSWSESWSKRRGGIFDININYESPTPWTPPAYGFYPMLDDTTIYNHIKDDTSLATDVGVLVDYATDSNILRRNGYALRLDGNDSGSWGANGAISWGSSINGSMTIFLQWRNVEMQNVANTGIQMVRLENNAGNYVTFRANRYDGSTGRFYAEWSNGGSTASIVTSPGTYDYDTWYDVAFTYDSQNDFCAIMFIPSATTSFTNYLDGITTLSDQYDTDITGAVYPLTNATWTNLYLMREVDANTLLSGDYAHMQNLFVFDSSIQTTEFNTLRRWCYIWNNKTSGTWPK